MPHVIVKVAEGKSEQQKVKLAEKILQDVMSVLNFDEEAVSLAIEEIPRGDWTERVYKTDILKNWDKLYKKPGYDPLK